MINDFFQKILDETPEEEKIFVDKYEEITMRIFRLLKQKGMSQKDLAKSLGKRPSEISKWLNEGHNLTLKTLAKIEAALKEQIISVPQSGVFDYVELESTQIKTSFQSVSLHERLTTIQYSDTTSYNLRIAG